jgi:hypothetical protein
MEDALTITSAEGISPLVATFGRTVTVPRPRGKVRYAWHLAAAG